MKKITYLVVSIVIVILLLFTIDRWFTKMPDVSAFDLLSKSLEIPFEWTNREGEKYHAEWTEYSGNYSEKDNDDTFQEKKATYLWTNNGSYPNPSIKETIIKFDPLLCSFFRS